MLRMLQRVQRWAERRLPALTRYRDFESLPIELHRRRIYIVPSGFGLGFSVLLMVMLVGALNYANNAALLLTCLLGAASAASMLVAFRNLDGLQLKSIRAGHAVAGHPVDITLTFESARERNAVRVAMGDVCIAFAIEAGGTADIRVPLATSERGWQAIPRLRVWTTWPLGIFRAWSWLHPQQSALIWPRAELFGPVPSAPAEDAQRMHLHRGDELASLRDYRAGDPQRHIAWKASAHHDNLLVKDFEQPQSRPRWQLDWRNLRGLDSETRIARLARWLNEAHAERRSYSLWLPGEEITNNSGLTHYVHCMNALAMLP